MATSSGLSPLARRLRIIESVFSGVRLQTDATRRMRWWDNVIYLVYKIVERPNQNWRFLNRGANLMALVLKGYTFKDRVLRPSHVVVGKGQDESNTGE